MNPYLLTFVAVNLLAGMTANGTGGVTLFMENFGARFLQPAINVGSSARIAAISGAGFDSHRGHCLPAIRSSSPIRTATSSSS